MRPWIPFDAEDWQENAEGLTKPWPRGSARFDLRWHADQGKQRGRSYWMSRWGWTDWAVRQLVKSETWVDPLADKKKRSTSRPPANHQPTTRPGKVEPEQSGEIHQPTTSRPPADRHTRVDPQPQPQPQHDLVPLTSSAKTKLTESRRVAATWHERHPRCDPPDDEEIKVITRCLEQRAKAIKGSKGRYKPEHYRESADDLILLLGWYHLSPDAKHWQGDNDRNTKYLGITTLFKPKPLADRIRKAKAWRTNGAPEATGVHTRGHVAEAEKAWAHVHALVCRSPRLPEQIHPDAAKEAAIRAALRSVRADDIRRETHPGRQKTLQTAFVEAYAAARSKPHTGEKRNDQRKT